jgi:ATP-dependent helicase HrpA
MNQPVDVVRPQATLPVLERREEFLAALEQHQVVIVCGETGSGKTTQLPQICLQGGRAADGALIGHTQPRRLAARSVSSRIASEMGTSVGQEVGFKIRFSDQVSAATRIKLMTDGILLAETRRDPLLKAYDTLIIDEAHERSLNIDFLLGYLKKLLPRRPDLKLVITSATIDPERFAHHFDGAPIIQAEGRAYPVEVRYAPPGLEREEGEDVASNDGMPEAVVEACRELLSERQHDVLVFFPGEREIREAADLLGKQASHDKLFRGVEILPLFSRLSNADQSRIFQAHTAPRIVLATNVAETSLTVPGIRSVVDTGLARVSRYSVRSQIQRLPVEKISQASANQRKGRCGRVAPGVCIRLYDEEDFEARPEFTEPEILRTNLAAVILQMRSMDLGAIDTFPFVEAPEPRFVNDGYRTLQELAALDIARELTPLGKRLARLPIDPRLGRMVLAAVDEGALDEVLTIVSALSVQDPRDRPFDKRQAADELHAEFNHERSDFLTWLNLWSFVTVQKEALSNSRFRKMCKQRFLAPMRILEWMDVRRQLVLLVRELKLVVNTTPAEEDNIHRALLTGLLANVATRTDKRDYLGTRNRHMEIFPGSVLFRRSEKPGAKPQKAATRTEVKDDKTGNRPGSKPGAPKWIMAAEIAETSRVFARSVGAISPTWIESAAEHLLQYSYRDAHWQRKSGRVSAYAQSTLYGLIINAKRRVDYARINPRECREIFIRDALVAGEIQTRAEFHRHNQALLTEVMTLEEKTRRRDIVIDPESLVRFYDSLLPEDVCTTANFETWRVEFEKTHPRGLFYSREQLLADGAGDIDNQAYPDQIEVGGLVLPLTYHFAPGETNDGVTLVCPVALLNRVSPQRCEWLVPGLLDEKIAVLIKALPKPLRRHFVPAPDYASACGAAMQADDAPLTSALSRQLLRMTGTEIAQSAWDAASLPTHLRMRFVVTDDAGKPLDEGRDLEVLQRRYQDQVEESLVQFGDDSLERESVTDWNFGDLEECVDVDNRGVTMQGYPALQVKPDGSVGIRLFASVADANAAMPTGVRALYRLVLREEVRYLARKLPGIDVMALRFATFGPKKALINDIIDAAIDHAFMPNGERPRTRDAFHGALESRRGELVGIANEMADSVADVLERHRLVARRIEGRIALSWIEAAADIKAQIASLIFEGFVTATGHTRLQRVPVYFEAMNKRLDAIDREPDKDRRRRSEFLPIWEAFQALPQPAGDGDYSDQHEGLRWAFEELRVQLFAQDLGTREKVSVSRLENRVRDLAKRAPRS